MSSEKPARRVQDILENAGLIFRYTEGMDVDAFRSDPKTRDAVERCLQRISEAATKLGDFAPVLMPDQPWAQIRALGNQLRHQYDAVEVEQLWVIVTKHLPSLVRSCEAALPNIPPKPATDAHS